MKIITFLNEKGGVGKTSLAVHVAAGLALKGYRVVLVDADPQGHATVTVGQAKSGGLYDLLVRDASFQSILRPISHELFEMPGQEVKGHLLLVPSNIETRNIANSISDAFAVREKFSELEKAIDVVVFDTSPTPSLLHGSIYLATYGIVYPTKLEYLAFDGLVESMKHRQQAEKHRQSWGMPSIENIGIIPTMYRASTLEHNENLAELRRMFPGKVWDPIPQRTLWTEAARIHRTVWNAMPNSKCAADAIRMVNNVEKELNNVVT